jgi:multiple sugar transport system permease protein/sn-glycerol 3-phosphate transport system permease protein
MSTINSAASRTAGGRGRVAAVASHAALLLVGAAVAIPYAWMALLSFKPTAELFAPATWFSVSNLTLEGYRQVFERAPFGRWALNSLVVACALAAGQVLTSLLAAYAFARFEFRGREACFWLVLLTMMVPPQTLMVPSYVIVHQLGWVNTFSGLVIPHLAWGFGIFMLRQFFLGVPRELTDAAALDGCGSLRTLWHVHVPLARTALAALTIIAFVTAWNEYYWPLIVVNSEEMRTLPIGIPRFTGADLDIQWQATMAAATMATLPVLALYIVAQKQFREGISRTGLKG